MLIDLFPVESRSEYSKNVLFFSYSSTLPGHIWDLGHFGTVFHDSTVDSHPACYLALFMSSSEC